jgi:NAD(P)-dependent dehydrogenase (short-subunit alcohol dehydrogenase family)
MSAVQPQHRPTALVTAGTAGIGFFTAVGLVQRGWAVMVTGRDQRRGEEAVAELRQQAGHDAVTFVPVDHSIVRHNTDLAATVIRQTASLELLVNNAGGIYTDRWETADGYEGTLAMNFVGPVALSLALLPALRRGHGRCVNVVSSAFAMVKGDPLADLTLQEGYVGINAYARAKRLNLLWAQALARREPDITVAAVNPGMAWTPSTKALRRAAVPAWRWVWPVVRWFQRRASPEKAAITPVRVGTGEIDAPSGTYINQKGKPERLPDSFSDTSMSAQVWALGESLVVRAMGSQARDPHPGNVAGASGDALAETPNRDAGGRR